MIKRLLQHIANRFMDTAWLRERRKQEVSALRHTRHIERRNRKERHFLEDELLQRLERKKGDGHA